MAADISHKNVRSIGYVMRKVCSYKHRAVMRDCASLRMFVVIVCVAHVVMHLCVLCCVTDVASDVRRYPRQR